MGRYDTSKEGAQPKEGEVLTPEELAKKYPWGDWKIGQDGGVWFKPHQLVGKYPDLWS